MTTYPLDPVRTGYSAAAKWLHWLMAGAILFTIPAGIAMVNLPQGPLQDRIFNLHRSFGFLILVLAVLRLAVRLAKGWPPPHPTLVPWQRTLSRFVHNALYGFIFAQPLIGWAGTSAFGAAIIVFGLFELPPILPQNEAVSKVLLGIHAYMGFAMAAFLALHIGAALMHAIVLRDGVLSRMLPSSWT